MSFPKGTTGVKIVLRLGTTQRSDFPFRKVTESLANTSLKCSHRILDSCCIFPAKESCTEASCCTNQPTLWPGNGSVSHGDPAEHNVALNLLLSSGNLPSSSGSSRAQLNCYQHQHRRLCQNAPFLRKRQNHLNHFLTRSWIWVILYRNIFMSEIKLLVRMRSGNTQIFPVFIRKEIPEVKHGPHPVLCCSAWTHEPICSLS